jgi:hypothetical protein
MGKSIEWFGELESEPEKVCGGGSEALTVF